MGFIYIYIYIYKIYIYIYIKYIYIYIYKNFDDNGDGDDYNDYNDNDENIKFAFVIVDRWKCVNPRTLSQVMRLSGYHVHFWIYIQSI